MRRTKKKRALVSPSQQRSRSSASVSHAALCCSRLAASGRLHREIPAAVVLAQSNGDRRTAAVDATSWTLMALLILSGLAVVIAMMRAGIRVFWVPVGG